MAKYGKLFKTTDADLKRTIKNINFCWSKYEETNNKKWKQQARGYCKLFDYLCHNRYHMVYRGSPWEE